MKRLLAHLGVLTPKQLDAASTSSPWFYAARVLAGGELLDWPALWDVLRWYAHNRGYDGNRRWSELEQDAKKEDTEKVENAFALFKKHGTSTMAQTWCAELKIDPLGNQTSSMVRFKGLDAAFPREGVEGEVRMLLEKHKGRLKGIDDKFIEALTGNDAQAWKSVPCPDLNLPLRYRGGLLFGQLIPRFENRIISQCPITFEREYQRVLAESGDEDFAKKEAAKKSKVPNCTTEEFYRFRWAMQVANIRIADPSHPSLRPLNVEERRAIDAEMRKAGGLTPGQLKKIVRELTGGYPDNLETMFSHPEAKKSLLVDPAIKLINNAPFSLVWDRLDPSAQKHLLTRLRRFQSVTLGELVENRPDLGKALEDHVLAENSRKGKGEKPLSLEELLTEKKSIDRPAGRAPYHRSILREAVRDVFEKGIHPKEEGGCLYRDEAIRNAHLQRAIDEQTNNRLVRHRLLILDRLHRDLLKEFAGGDPGVVDRVTIEVNRDMRKMSGRTAKEIAQEEGLRLANFKSVTKKLEEVFAGKNMKISAGLIRKARIAEDLGWKCPYTGQSFDAFALLDRRVDKDHIIPRSQRPSDSLDSLVITFSQVNKMKGNRTALQFIREFQSQTVAGLENLTIKPLSTYLKDVKGLEEFRGHDDDKRRKKNRKRLLEMESYVEKEFVPGDLTQTSQLVRLAAQNLKRPYEGFERQPVVVSLPGSVTGAVRKSWKLQGCLAGVNPKIDEGTTKAEIRGLTHLHHALDACVLALASEFLPRKGDLWELLVKRRLTEAEQGRLLQMSSMFQRGTDGKVALADPPNFLKEQIRQCLLEKRVVQHIPADVSGLASEETVYRVFDPKDPHPSAQRLAQWFRRAGVDIPGPESEKVLVTCRKRRGSPGSAESGKRKLLYETPTWRWTYNLVEKSKLIGLEPSDPSTAKLLPLKAVKKIGSNFGLALDPEPEIIRAHKIWPQLRELQKKNGGRKVRVLRNGMLVRLKNTKPNGSRNGIWRIISLKATLKLDLVKPDQAGSPSKGPTVWREVSIASLGKDNIVILPRGYGGCPDRE